MQAHGRAVVEPNKKRKKKPWVSSTIFLLGNRFFLTPEILRQSKQYFCPKKALNQCWGSDPAPERLLAKSNFDTKF
jgi:hypothetical protein